jgi:hypothetical protein
MILHTTSGQWFLKGVRAGHPRAAWTHANEAAINPWVAPVTAPLEFRVQADGWDVLGFGYLAGHRHADLAPGSPDLPAITAALQALAAIPAPRAVQLRAIEDRWREYIGDRAALLAGPAIAHTDLHRHNIMIGASAKLIDWAWPTLAAPWVDTACVGLQLITAGHHPAAGHHSQASRRNRTGLSWPRGPLRAEDSSARAWPITVTAVPEATCIPIGVPFRQLIRIPFAFLLWPEYSAPRMFAGTS